MQETYIDPGHFLCPFIYDSHIDKCGKAAPAIATEHVPHTTRSILVPLQFVLALYPFNAVVSAIRIDVKIAVFSANGAVTAGNKGRRAGEASCTVQRLNPEASAGTATMAVGIIPYFVVMFFG